MSSAHVLHPCFADLPLRARRLLAPFVADECESKNQACTACDMCALAIRRRLSAEQVRRAAGDKPLRYVTDSVSYVRPGRSPGAPLHVLGACELDTFVHVGYDYGVEAAEPTSRIGVIYRCNQGGTFCQLADVSGELSVEKVHPAIDAARARRLRGVILTAGEPTLSKNHAEHNRYAASVGVEHGDGEFHPIRCHQILAENAAQEENPA